MLRLKAALILIVVSIAFSVSAQEETHVVLPGENLFRISQQYGIDVDSIARANQITNTWRIYPGQTLIIPSETGTGDTSDVVSVPAPSDSDIVVVPVPPASDLVVVPVPTATPDVQYYTVTYGQSLAQIAQNYGMTLDQIARLNHITNPDLIYAGQKLVVSSDGSQQPAAQQPAPDTSAPEITNTVTHIVQEGETLASIGDRYGVSWLQIAQANSIYDADHISVGEELLIPGGSVIPGADFSFVSAPAAPPAYVGHGKEVVVDISDSRAYAYEDGKLVRNVLVSTGLPGTPTVKGDFKVQRKYVAQTMTGPGYYLPDVPYVMYFFAGYALHGTYWHNNFGHPMSHGCVNLPTAEAAWFYDWTEVGTPVHVEA